MTVKECKTCGEHKPAEAFPRNGMGGRKPHCGTCRNSKYRDEYVPAKSAAYHAHKMQSDPYYSQKRRWYGVESRTGWSREQSMAALETQRGLCAICSRALKRTGRRGSDNLHHDHCHDSEKTRALLCSSCNIGLGKFRDNPDLMMRAAAYLEHHKQTPQASGETR